MSHSPPLFPQISPCTHNTVVCKTVFYVFWTEQADSAALFHGSLKFLLTELCQTGFPSTDSRQSHRVHPVHAKKKPHPPARHRWLKEAECTVGTAGWVEELILVSSFSSNVPYLTRGVIIWVLFVSLCLCMLLQSVHWRKPRGTVSSSQTTRLIAACTKTAKAVRCPPLTVGPTPAPSRSQTSRPTERSCAQSPARLNLALVLQTDSFCPPAPPHPHPPHTTTPTCLHLALPSYTSPGDEQKAVWERCCHV